MQEKIKNAKGEIVSFVTQIILENGKVYTLYTDGNLYEEVEGKGLTQLDNLNEGNKKIISKIMEQLTPGKMDVIDTGKKVKKRKIIEIEEL